MGDEVDERLVPVPGSWVYTVEIDGEAVLLDEDRNRLHMLNPTGAMVWACFDGRARVSEIADDISDELGVARDEVLHDTLALVRHLGQQGLLQNVAASPDLEEGEGPRVEVVMEEDDCPDDGDGEQPDWADDPRFVAEPPNV